MLNSEITILADAAAKRHNLPPNLVYAIIQAESGGNPWAIRYEPAFYSRYVIDNPPKGRGTCSDDTESRMQAASWGLMQIMGATARNAGFNGVFLSELCDPKVGIEWSCKHLAGLAARYHRNWRDVAAAYNAGSVKKEASGAYRNQDYVEKIQRFGGFA